MTNDFTVKNQKTGYKYRVVGIHYVESNGKGQSFMTKTKGVMITEYWRLIPNGDSVTKSIFVTRNSMKKAII